MIQAWHAFLDSLGTDGGRIFCLFLLLGLGIICSGYKVAGAESILTGSFGALLLALKTTGTNKQATNDKPTP